MGKTDLQRIGKGSTAVVYKGWYRGKEAAFKCSTEQTLLRKEAAYLQQLHSPYFPAYYGYETESGDTMRAEDPEESVTGRREESPEKAVDERNTQILIMEYVRGQNLEVLMKSFPNGLQRQEAYELAEEILCALAVLHRQPQPLLYLDLKPENIMVSENGQVRLIDLGAVLKEGEIPERIGGTYGYSSPEQFWPGAQLHPSSDIYSFGKILFYLLTGRDPVLIQDLKKTFIQRNDSLQEGERQFLLKCLAEDPRERFPHAVLAIEGLKEAQKEKKRSKRSCLIYEKSVLRVSSSLLSEKMRL